MPFRSTKPKRFARSVKEIRRRQLGDDYQSFFDRILYMILSGVLFGFLGLLLDFIIATIGAISNINNGNVFWLFTPFLIILGAVTGFIYGKNSGSAAMQMLRFTKNDNMSASLMPDLFRGIGIAIAIFALVLIITMIKSH